MLEVIRDIEALAFPDVYPLFKSIGQRHVINSLVHPFPEPLEAL